MKVQELMSKQVKPVAPHDTIQQAAQSMEKLDCGALPVVDHDRLVGILTDRDIAIRCAARGTPSGRCTVEEVMSKDVKPIFEDQPAEDVARMMSRQQVRRVPVLDRNNHLVGIVSLADLVRKQDGQADEALRGISARASAARA